MALRLSEGFFIGVTVQHTPCPQRKKMRNMAIGLHGFLRLIFTQRADNLHILKSDCTSYNG